ncbi:MAG: hypothetical protein ACREBD_29815 [Blastocatellia bacterium]
MRRKLVFAVVCLSLVSIIAFTFASHSRGKMRDATQNPSARIQSDNPPPPPRLVYRFLFRHVVSLKQKAAELKSRGLDSKGIENFYRNEAQLTDNEAQILEDIAADSVRDVEQLDALAKTIIDAERARYPEGRIAKGQEIPPPPGLEQLQEQRDAAMTRAYNRLRAAFGEQRFRNFDSFAQRSIGSKISPIASRSRRPGLPPEQGNRRSLPPGK